MDWTTIVYCNQINDRRETYPIAFPAPCANVKKLYSELTGICKPVQFLYDSYDLQGLSYQIELL